MTDFEQQVIEGLAELRVEVSGVKEQVAKQNGNVARVTERVNQLETASSNKTAADAAVLEEKKSWHKRLDPFMTYGILALIYLILDKGPQIVKAFGK